MVIGVRTCLRDCNDFVVVAVSGSLEVLWELGGLATSCLADDDCYCVVFDGVEKGIFVTGYWQQRAGPVQCWNKGVRVGHIVRWLYVVFPDGDFVL
jgi:hypothetical protein